MVQIDLTTKSCPFCAETIQSAAVKCRFCGEFLNTAKARALLEEQDAEVDEEINEQEEPEDGILYAGRPSILGMIPGFIKAGIVLTIIYLVIKYPLEEMINGHLGIKISDLLAIKIGYYRVMAGWGLFAIIIFGLLLKALKLKMIYYEVSSDRIEWSRGILDRKVDNIDMFRVVDLKLRRNIFDCIFGIGRVTLITTDKTDPNFTFEKVYRCRELYDIIKKASLEADRKTGVVHLE